MDTLFYRCGVALILITLTACGNSWAAGTKSDGNNQSIRYARDWSNDDFVACSATITKTLSKVMKDLNAFEKIFPYTETIEIIKNLKIQNGSFSEAQYVRFYMGKYDDIPAGRTVPANVNADEFTKHCMQKIDGFIAISK